MNVGGPGGADGGREKQPDDEDDDFEDEVNYCCAPLILYTTD
jgi:hypothetical protein